MMMMKIAATVGIKTVKSLEGQIQIIYLHTMTAAAFFFSIQTLPLLRALQVSTRKSISK